MNDWIIHQAVGEVFARMDKAAIDHYCTGSKVVLRGLKSQDDKDRYEFETLTALTNFLDGYEAGLAYTVN